MASIWEKLTFKSLKITNTNNNNVTPSSTTVQLPNQIFVRACKIGFPFLVLANVAISGYVMAKAKERDEGKAKEKANAKKRDGVNAKKSDGVNAKQEDVANTKHGHNVST